MAVLGSVLREFTGEFLHRFCQMRFLYTLKMLNPVQNHSSTWMFQCFQCLILRFYSHWDSLQPEQSFGRWIWIRTVLIVISSSQQFPISLTPNSHASWVSAVNACDRGKWSALFQGESLKTVGGTFSVARQYNTDVPRVPIFSTVHSTICTQILRRSHRAWQTHVSSLQTRWRCTPYQTHYWLLT